MIAKEMIIKSTAILTKRARCARCNQSMRAKTNKSNKSALPEMSSAIVLRDALEELSLEQTRDRARSKWKDLFDDRTAFVLEPDGVCWGYVHFIGGAVLGQYPQVAYDLMLTEISARTPGLCVICTPYELGTNHGEIAKECENAFEKAVQYISLKNGNSSISSENENDANRIIPRFYVGHSLGAKLHVCKGNDSGKRGRHFLIAFNNASASDSVKILEKFAKEILRKEGDGASSTNFDAIFARIVPLAEFAAKQAGFEFIPNAAETLNMVANKKFQSERVTLLSFSNDDLDQSASLREALADGEIRTSRAEIFGDHLSPVVLDLDKYAKVNPMFNRFGGVTIGDRVVVQKIVDELVQWLRE